MPWFKVDDSFPEHPKLESLEANPLRYMAAVTVWCVMGADCARRLTDGFVSTARLAKVLRCLGKHAQEGAAALVEIGLWESADGGWQYHDWREYQPTKASVNAVRKAKTERQRRWRDARVDASTGPSTEPHTPPSTGASTDGFVDGLQKDSGDAAPRARDPDPSHPIPTRPDQREGESGAGAPATNTSRGPTSVERSRAKLDTLLAVAGSLEAAREGAWTAQAQRVAFQGAYERSQRTTPAMGGRQVGSFHGEVLRTAELQGRDPGELFAEALSAWLARGLSETERRAPYACFQAAWGDLTAKGTKKLPDGSGGPPATPRTYSPEDLKPKLFPKDRA